MGERRVHLDRNGQPVLSEGLEEETPLLSGLLDGHQVPRELGEEGHALQNLWERGSRWEHADAWPPCQPWFLPPHDPRGCALGSPMEGFGKVTADASLVLERSQQMLLYFKGFFIISRTFHVSLCG